MRFNRDQITPQLAHLLTKRACRTDLLAGFDVDEATLTRHRDEAVRHHPEKTPDAREAVAIYGALFDRTAPHAPVINPMAAPAPESGSDEMLKWTVNKQAEAAALARAHAEQLAAGLREAVIDAAEKIVDEQSRIDAVHQTFASRAADLASRQLAEQRAAGEQAKALAERAESMARAGYIGTEAALDQLHADGLKIAAAVSQSATSARAQQSELMQWLRDTHATDEAMESARAAEETDRQSAAAAAAERRDRRALLMRAAQIVVLLGILLLLATRASAQGTGTSVQGMGTAGSAKGGVVTVQGSASGTAIPVSGSLSIAANASVNVNQVGGTATDTNSGNKSAGTIRVVLATDQPQPTNKFLVTPDSNVQVIPVTTATTTDAASTSATQSAASTNSTSVKGSAGNVYGYYIINTTSTNYFLRMYNSSSAPTCSSSTGFVETIPALGASANGGGIARMQVAQAFSTGIGFCLTGGGSSTDNTNAATGVYVTILYK